MVDDRAALALPATLTMLRGVRTSDFDYPLPEELIAQEPLPRRDQSRLLVLERAAGRWSHRAFTELPGLLRAGDVLVFNDSKVLPARLRARDPRTDGRFEILLVRANAPEDWWALMRPGKRAPVGKQVELLDGDGAPTGVVAEVVEVNAEGHRRLILGAGSFEELAGRFGEMPLPPYIRRPAGSSRVEDIERYQTVFAGPPGSVAAPTAGLHFTPELLAALGRGGIEIRHVTLHVGLGTFSPVKVDDVAGHQMHEERFSVSEETAAAVGRAKREGRRVISVGTTTLRVLESVAAENGGAVVPGAGSTRIFLRPPARFLVADALLTNFHLPQSTLLMLVSAFAAPEHATAGRDLVLRAYAEAVHERYRFFSYGDAMLLA